MIMKQIIRLIKIWHNTFIKKADDFGKILVEYIKSDYVDIAKAVGIYCILYINSYNYIQLCIIKYTLKRRDR